MFSDYRMCSLVAGAAINTAHAPCNMDRGLPQNVFSDYRMCSLVAGAAINTAHAPCNMDRGLPGAAASTGNW